MNASPGELRLWKKLNGVLDADEKKADDIEHSKARSRANLAGRPRQALPKAAPGEAGKPLAILVAFSQADGLKLGNSN